MSIDSSGIATFTNNTKIKKAGRASLHIGSTDASGAVIFLDGDSNGDVSGGDYSFIEHTSSGDLCFYADNPNNNSKLKFYTADAGTLSLTLDGYDATVAGDISDSKGNLRTLPRNEPGALYTAVTADKGKFISNGNDVTFDNTATWNTGDVVTVYNYSTSTIQIISGTGVLIHYTDGTTASTGNRTLAARGLCTLLCVEGSNNTFVISGALT